MAHSAKILARILAHNLAHRTEISAHILAHILAHNSAHNLANNLKIFAIDFGTRFGRTTWARTECSLGALRPSMRRFVLHCLSFFPCCSLPRAPPQPAPFPIPPQQLAHAQWLFKFVANNDLKAVLGPFAWRSALSLAT